MPVIKKFVTRKIIKSVDETHMKGFMSVELPDMDSRICDFGIQVAADGHVWICIDGIAFIRFKPLSDKMIELAKKGMEKVEKINNPYTGPPLNQCCYGQIFYTSPNTWPYPSQAQKWESVTDCMDAYAEFLLECDSDGTEPAPHWVYLGSPVGDEEKYGYPDSCDFYIEPDENNPLTAVIKLG